MTYPKSPYKVNSCVDVLCVLRDEFYYELGDTV